MMTINNGFSANNIAGFAEVFCNGKRITVNGNDISIINDKIYVDGKEYVPNEKLIGDIKIVINGNVENVESYANLEIHGNVNNVKSNSNFTCNDVKGDVKSNGTLTCRDILGTVKSNGIINCKSMR